jgi:hypothetical protein
MKIVRFDNPDGEEYDEDDGEFSPDDGEFDPEAAGTESDGTSNDDGDSDNSSTRLLDLEDEVLVDENSTLKTAHGGRKRKREADPIAANLQNDSIIVHIDEDEQFSPEATTDESDTTSEEGTSSGDSDTSDETDEDSSSDDSSIDSDSSDSSSDGKSKEFPNTAGANSRSGLISASTKIVRENAPTKKQARQSAKMSTNDADASTKIPQINADASTFPVSPFTLAQLRKQKSSETETNVLVPPGEGKPETKRRNERRKLKKKMKEKLQRSGLADDGIDNMQNGQQSHNESSFSNSVTLATNGLTDDSAHKAKSSKESDFEERRRQLLQSLESGGIELDRDNEDKVVTKSEDGIPMKRMKLDLASSRRLLFGSLGLRNPKTKEEEQKLAQKLMSQGQRPHLIYPAGNQNASLEDEVAKSSNGEVKPNEDGVPFDKSWQARINLSAVECIDEDVVLSKPPFPFLQRWDSQYQNGKRSRKKNKTLHKSQEDSIDISLQDESNTFSNTLNNDLPELPAEPDTLPDAKAHDITAGTIIAFKQVECDENTSWRPTISPYRTARVDEVIDGSNYHLVLAQRDRIQNEPKYDDKGNRIFGRFEMPEDDDTDDKQDDGLRMISFGDMMEPKIIQIVSASRA